MRTINELIFYSDSDEIKKKNEKQLRREISVKLKEEGGNTREQRVRTREQKNVLKISESEYENDDDDDDDDEDVFYDSQEAVPDMLKKKKKTFVQSFL